jgi:hypothetical protein
MRKNAAIKYIGLIGLIVTLMFLGTFSYSTAQANSYSYTVFNHTGDTAWTIFDNGEMSVGWYGIDPQKSRTFPSSRSTVYFYATSDAGWAGGTTTRLIHPKFRYKIVYLGHGDCRGYVRDTDLNTDCGRLTEKYGFERYGLWPVKISRPQELHYYGNYVIRADASSRIAAYVSESPAIAGCLTASHTNILLNKRNYNCGKVDENLFGFLVYNDNKFRIRSLKYPKLCGGISPNSNSLQAKYLHLTKCDNERATLFQLEFKGAAGPTQPPRIVHEQSNKCLQIVKNEQYSLIGLASCSWKYDSRQGFEFRDFDTWEKGFR